MDSTQCIEKVMPEDIPEVEYDFDLESEMVENVLGNEYVE